MSISIEVNDAEVLRALEQLAGRAENIQPALAEIGESLVESTKKRFGTETGPDGSSWEANSPVTLSRKESSSVLTDSGTLGDTINYQLFGDELHVGSNMDYAAMMQFGGSKAEFPHLWGDIPARPFLGISSDDKDEILVILADYLGF